MKHVYVVAEISANHNGEISRAKDLICEAKRAGADAVKIQTFTPDTMTINCKNDDFVVGKDTAWSGKTLYDLYEEAYLPWGWIPELQKLAADIGIGFFSTVFDETSLDFLEKLNMERYKISSFEITDIPLIQKVAKTKKPIILSTGMATLDEISAALKYIHMEGNHVTLLKCTSAYPAPLEEMNLKTIEHMRNFFCVPSVGLSDHSISETIPIAAVAMGASMIEKHLTLERHSGGPDASFSMEPNEFRNMVKYIRETEKAVGNIHYGPTKRESSSLQFRRSLFSIKDISSGEIFTEQNIKCIRPGTGLSPGYMPNVLGKRAKTDIPRGTPLSIEKIF